MSTGQNAKGPYCLISGATSLSIIEPGRLSESRMHRVGKTIEANAADVDFKVAEEKVVAALQNKAESLKELLSK